jgi:hypothetical protein
MQLWVEDAPFIRYYLPLTDKLIEKKIYKEKLMDQPKKKSHFVKVEKGVELIRNGLNGRKL